MKPLKLYKNDLFRIIAGASIFLVAIALQLLNIKIAAIFCFVLSLVICGGLVFVSAVRGIFRGDLLDERFLMTVASIGAMILGDFAEGVAVMLFFNIGEYFQHKAVKKSRNAIKELMDICPDTARIITENGEELVDAEDVPTGTKIAIRAGERVPIDAVICEGSADIDTSAITGESIPVYASIGSKIKSGSIVLNGVVFALTECEFEDSTASKILELVENANEKKSKTESFITAFSRVYTPVVVALALILAILPASLSLTSFSESVRRALSFLVISCPCALVISVPLSFFGGIGSAASQGILLKGGNVFSALSKLKLFAFDKTGTLTSGEFVLERVDTYGVSKDELLNIAATAEQNSNHPIALAIKNSGKIIDGARDFSEIAGMGVSVNIGGDVCHVGNRTLMERQGVHIPVGVENSGVLVCKNHLLLGCIYLSDKPKDEGVKAINALYSLGIKKCVILSGDTRENVTRIGTKLGIKDCFWSLLPDEKYEKLEQLSAFGPLAFVGDGINDAPSLARADVGIAMGNVGSDAAIESADLVIMTDNLEKLPLAIKIARKTMRIASENIVFALGVKLLILILGALGIAGMWLAVFADVGVALLAILNSMRTLVKRG